jgi:hypothetical protein
MGTGVQVLLASVDGTSLGNVRSCKVYKSANSLKLRQLCGLDGILNLRFGDLPKRPLVRMTRLFNHFLSLSHFPKPWREAKTITLPKAGTDPKLPHNLHPISLFSTTGKLFEKVIPKRVQRHIDEKGLLNAYQSLFRARHSTTLQCKRLRIM